jgi:hypothetical protein
LGIWVSQVFVKRTKKPEEDAAAAP